MHMIKAVTSYRGTGTSLCASALDMYAWPGYNVMYMYVKGYVPG